MSTTHEIADSSTLLFQEHVSLSQYSTFGIGGPARFFCPIRTAEQMQEAILTCISRQIPYLVIGKGSNVLFDDRGFDGAILYSKIGGCHYLPGHQVEVGSGYSFALLGNQTARNGYAGLEFASGIPGSVGGAIFMNAGANGQETCNALYRVDYIDEQGNYLQLKRSELEFGYRHSSFQKRRGAIVKAIFALEPSPEARQKQLDIVAYRTRTQPYSDKSAGCIFRNPDMCAAGALIDQSGLKGYRIGGAAISDKHANFIINAGGATAQDVLQLIQIIQSTVQNLHDVYLACEVRCIPFRLE